MAQLSGTFTIELAVDRLADQIADRVLERLQQAAREASGPATGAFAEPVDTQLVPPRTNTGADIYERPDPEVAP